MRCSEACGSYTGVCGLKLIVMLNRQSGNILRLGSTRQCGLQLEAGLPVYLDRYIEREGKVRRQRG